MYETKIISNTDEFKLMREEWNQLLQRSYMNTIFLTWEWLFTWWEVFGKEEELFIVAVRDKNGKLVGIAPLFIRKTKYYKFPVREMAFIGTGLSDRQDFIISEQNTQVIQAIIFEIYQHKGKWNIVLLEQIPSKSPVTSLEMGRAVRYEIEDSSICPFVQIEGTWDVYSKSLSRKFRKDIRNKMNNMARLGTWEFRVIQVADGATGILDSMKDIESKSRKQGTEKTFFNAQNKEFLARFCELSRETGWLDYSALCINDTQVAYLFGYLYNDKYYAYNTAYLEEFDGVSPGKLVLNEKIKWCFEQAERPKEFDFLRGDHYIKSLWASESRQHIRMVLFNGSVYSKLIRLAVFRARPFIKNFIRKDNKISSNQDQEKLS